MEQNILKVMEKHLENYDYSEDQFDGRFSSVMKEALPKVAKELAERIEIDEDIVMQVLQRYWGVLEESYYIDENGWENKDFIKLLVKSCPIKIKEADDEI